MSQGQGACSEPKMHVAPALPTEVYTIAEHLSVQDTARLIGVCKASSRLRPREKVLKHYYDMLQRNRSGCCEVTLSANSIRSTAASRRQKKRARYKPALIKPPLKRHQRG